MGLLISAIACRDSDQKKGSLNTTQTGELSKWLTKHKPEDSLYQEKLLKSWEQSAVNDSTTLRLIEKYGNSLLIKNKVDSIFFGKLIKNLPSITHNKFHHSLLNIAGGYLNIVGKADSAIHFFEQAIKIYEKSGSDSLMESSYLNQGRSLYKKTLYKDALLAYKKALNYSVKLPQNGNRWTIEASIGNVYLDLNEDEKAAEQYRIAAEAFTKEKHYERALVNYSSLTNAYSKLKDSVRGIKASNRALFLLDSLKPDDYSAFTVYYSRANLLKKIGKLDESLEMLEKSIEAQRRLKNIFLANRLQLYKVEVYAALKQWDKAREILVQLLSFAKNYKEDPSYLMDVYGQLARVENASQNYKDALTNFSNYYRIKDSIDVRKQATDIIKLEKEFQTKEKDLQLKLQAQKLQSIEKEKNMWTAITILAILTAGIGIYYIYARRKQQMQIREAELKQKYHQDLVIATENEQARIAMDLHDGVASELLVLKSSLVTNPLQHTKKQIDEIIQDIRMLTRKLYPVQLKKVGLCTATIDLINQLDKEHDVFFSTEIDESLNNILSAEKQLYVFRIIQEGLTNILKHANAQAAFIEISANYEGNFEYVNLTIKDNGKGFRWPFPEGIHTETLGLASIQHRAGVIGASLIIDSIVGQGTTIYLKIPVL
ncbi:hypothetical protein GCM10011514_53290 [Emticicia aquatilis]|uniref:histidine kinase n=2 Tax=Emticicia aquatilis TaxID=1537369 RepID=A0A917DZM2_9BACT|nr:hypothetical protein GCM10011514_53290 [Emticicia aquatilis]